MDVKKNYYDPKSFWSDRLGKFGDLKGVGFAVLGNNFNKWIYKARIDNLKKVSRDFDFSWEDMEILDIGFGNGFFERFYLDQKVKRVFGVDINTSTIDEVREEFPQYKFQVMDITESEVGEKEPFDLATLFAVVYHIVDDEKLHNALIHIREALKPGGIFLITGDFNKYKAIPQTCPHFKSRSFPQIKEILSKTGFEIVGALPVTDFLQEPRNWKNKLIRLSMIYLWRGFAYLVTRTEATGWLGGAKLYYLDKILLSIFKRGLSETIIIARKY